MLSRTIDATMQALLDAVKEELGAESVIILAQLPGREFPLAGYGVKNEATARVMLADALLERGGNQIKAGKP